MFESFCVAPNPVYYSRLSDAVGGRASDAGRKSDGGRASDGGRKSGV